MGKVYVVQEVEGRNILPAGNYGKITILLPPGQTMFTTDRLVRKLQDGLKSFSDEDYLLLMGDPLAIGLATTVALNNNQGHAKFLKWDRQEKQYYELEAII